MKSVLRNKNELRAYICFTVVSLSWELFENIQSFQGKIISKHSELK